MPGKKIINCHAHIFNGSNVPPYLAKRFLWFPFYWILQTPLIMWVFKCTQQWWWPENYWYQGWFKKLQAGFYAYRAFIRRYLVTNVTAFLINAWLTTHAVIYLFKTFIIKLIITLPLNYQEYIHHRKDWLVQHNLYWESPDLWLKFGVVMFVLIFIKWGRAVIWMILKSAWSFLKWLPDKKSIEFVKRYINIGRFANYKDSDDIYRRLVSQYENKEAGFVILPMDMHYMRAGKIYGKGSYENQMASLAKLKTNNPENVYPFVFVDPRRITGNENNEGDAFFNYTNKDGKVTLGKCFVKEYLEDNRFSGIKIYPALGYYPFDVALLPLWKYAADNSIPIMTHAIRGTIFYRGTKKKEWGRHPVIKQSDGNKSYDDYLLLPELKNIDYINNFTHPLNYLCLVEEELLRQWVGNARTPQHIRDLFGYNGPDKPMTYDLKNLKICMGHFGGDDEWEKFLEADRDDSAAKLMRDSERGIDFLYNSETGKKLNGKLEQLWRKCDWYSIICSMMMQYPNIYADISYIVHNDAIFPLLKRTLRNSLMKNKVLYGTDFYVVRNHKSEKQILIDTEARLSAEEFNLIARENPGVFLKLDSN